MTGGTNRPVRRSRSSYVDVVARRGRRMAARALQAGLERVDPGRTVIRTEYATRPRAMWGWGKDANPAMRAILDASLPEAERLATQFDDLVDWCATVPRDATTAGGLAWDNRYWSSIDAVMQVHALRVRRPTTYLEVGSGYSTMFARRAIEDFGLPTRIVSVDPHPRADIDALCDEVVRAPFEDVADAVLGRLAPGDVFLFDGSHLATMASDAAVLFSGGLELVPEDVLVGIDDIYLPWDYHGTWTGRFYGEQYLVAAWLLGGARDWQVRLPAWHVTVEADRADLFEALWPHIEAWGGRRGTALWVERTAAAA